MKILINEEVLCKNLPKEFEKYLKSVKNLSFSEKPNYSEYKENFRNLLKSLNLNIGIKKLSEFERANKEEKLDPKFRESLGRKITNEIKSNLKKNKKEKKNTIANKNGKLVIINIFLL